MKNGIYSVISTLFFFLSEASAVTNKLTSENNKKIVRSFYDAAFNQHKPKEAVQEYVGPDYIQHNPFVATGKQPFIEFFIEFQKKHPQSHAEIKRVIAEEDLVVVHVHSTLNPEDRGRAVMDVFRLERGKIVEHWDVGQPILEKSANNNTMF